MQRIPMRDTCDAEVACRWCVLWGVAGMDWPSGGQCADDSNLTKGPTVTSLVSYCCDESPWQTGTAACLTGFSCLAKQTLSQQINLFEGHRTAMVMWGNVPCDLGSYNYHLLEITTITHGKSRLHHIRNDDFPTLVMTVATHRKT